jgi:flagella basal body P-ring formation protein FlgA
MSLLYAVPLLATPERARVPASDVVATARAWLDLRVKQDGIPAQLNVVGHVNDVQLQVDGVIDLHVNDLKSGWLRPRVGIPVQILAAGKPVTSVTVWFSVSAPVAGLVYTSNQRKGVFSERLNVQTGEIDLARTKGKSMLTTEQITGMRLVKAVVLGQAVQMDDFEAIPAVQAQQEVRVETKNGAVHLSMAGHVLSDANIGDMVQVLPINAVQPVRARVISQQVVIIEN